MDDKIKKKEEYYNQRERKYKDYCQCKISLPTQVYMFSIRRSRLYTSVCTIHVGMSCVAYRCTDPGP